VQKKTFTPDFLSHEKKYNRGQEEFVIIKDHHEPIISRELFDKANRILDAKSLSQEGKAKHSNRYPFSGKIKCGRCGASYVARYKTRKDGSRYKSWRCYEAANHGRPHIDKAGNQVGCYGESIRNEDAVYLLYLVCRELKINRRKVVDNLTKTIDAVMRIDLTGTSTSALSEKIEEAKKKRTGLIDLYTSGDIDKTEFTALRAKYDEDIEKLKSMAEGTRQQTMLLKQKELMENIKNAIDELINGTLYEDEYYARILDKMVVGDKNHIDVYLKMLPHKWSFTLAKGVTGASETLKKADAPENSISEASLPISVNNPIPILSGMENLCDK
ncbi:MAG TPA: recombinase family protein, partial [Ruminococcaceae bacterium]|nr:recombinase family protein [Oscillospiraceae bacterium]